MKIGDTVRSKSTNLLYKVVQKKENREGYICEPVTAIMHPDAKFYFFDDEVDVVSENTELSVEEKDMSEKALSWMEFLRKLDAEVLKAELLAFLDCEDIEVDSMEEFKEQFIDYIKEDFSYGDCE